ncbi:MAG: hypothetical protein J6S67_05480 [Methanobrevibacter sp.]|nr:hypothetical protein [Methanobrevibacter sp.]
MLKKSYYYTLKEAVDESLIEVDLSLFAASSFKSFLEALDIDTTEMTSLPFSLTNTNVEELWQRIIANYHDSFAIKINCFYHEIPSNVDIIEALIHWAYKVINFIAQTNEYYLTLLNVYSGAKAELMSDIKALSKNKVKFNDTPQNTNESGTYEGDNYITHFTATEGETSSPLMSKMMRLKEIQDNYHYIMGDWVKKANCLFIEEENIL